MLKPGRLSLLMNGLSGVGPVQVSGDFLRSGYAAARERWTQVVF
jgi:hypothetical protein